MMYEGHMPSEEQARKSMKAEREAELKAVYASALRKATEVINRSKLITEDVKEELVKEIWK